MRNFFRSLERHRVRHLLISGQACVLYGASQFSEDVDLWVRPDRNNFRRLLAALLHMDARVHKLTPPVQARYVGGGHGFHWIIPAGAEPEIYLDVMGRPPRVSSFDHEFLRARRLRTPWGTLAVIAPEALVEIKKTRRLSDYDVITNLVRRRLAEEAEPPRRLVRWAIRNAFRAEDLLNIVTLERGGRPPRRPAARLAWRATRSSTPPDSRVLSKVTKTINIEIAALQEADRRYWSPVLRDLRELRGSGGLIPEGTPTRDLIGRRSRREN